MKRADPESRQVTMDCSLFPADSFVAFRINWKLNRLAGYNPAAIIG
jgi:hypothetical protein